ncbi:MAG TPA: 6,7-dimethyl-8-ribityllumazine synthase [Candidatus Kapabacteria bacterium]|jgi:6,7-dimethyl-8-ribityllumazine synthase
MGEITRIKGSLDGTGMRIGIVVSRWNHAITDALLHGALRALAACSVAKANITIVEVPGALEIPLAAEVLADSGMAAIVALGCVIKGDTAHFEHVSRLALDGIQHVVGHKKIPVTCGILTTYDIAQAEARSGADEANVGSQAALTAIETANALRNIPALDSGKYF